MNGTGSKFWIGMVLGIIGMLIVLFMVPIIRDLAVGITVENALNILEREGYVAYSNPEGELITKGVLPETADTYELGNVNYEWKNLYLGDDGGIFLGKAQDAYLHRHAADQLGVHSDLNLEGNALLGGTNISLKEKVVGGWGVWLIQPPSGDTHAALELAPAGTSTRSTLSLWNASDITNAGRLYVELVGTTVKLQGVASGTGSAPTEFQISGMTLKVNDIDELTAGAGLTLKNAVVAAGDSFTIGEHVFKDGGAGYLDLRDLTDTTYSNLRAGYARFYASVSIAGDVIFLANGSVIRPPDYDGYYTAFQARDTGVGLVEVARLQGAAEPFMQLSSLGYGVKTITADYIAAYDAVIRCDASAGALTISLPTASGITGKAYLIKKVDSSANAITIDPYGTETIDGAATVTLASQYDSVIVVSDGTNWMKF